MPIQFLLKIAIFFPMTLIAAPFIPKLGSEWSRVDTSSLDDAYKDWGVRIWRNKTSGTFRYFPPAYMVWFVLTGLFAVATISFIRSVTLISSTKPLHHISRSARKQRSRRRSESGELKRRSVLQTTECRMRNAIAIMLTCFFCAPCVSQEQEAPKTLVGFLKPGMHIGVSFYPNSDRITIEIYSEQDLAIAIDARNLSLEELASKYERVATELERTRKDILSSLHAKTEDIPPGKEYGEPDIRLRSNQTEAFYKITATGDDYILVTNAVSPSKRRVLATRFISSINWRDELAFTWSVPHKDKTTDRTKRLTPSPQ